MEQQTPHTAQADQAPRTVPLCDADFGLILRALRHYAETGPGRDLAELDSLLGDLEAGRHLWIEAEDAAASDAGRFCADPSALAADYGAVQTYAVDDSAELRFPDGSHAACCDGGPWLPERLRQDIRDFADAAAAVAGGR
jgi:hypothetical protein